QHLVLPPFPTRRSSDLSFHTAQVVLSKALLNLRLPGGVELGGRRLIERFKQFIYESLTVGRSELTAAFHEFGHLIRHIPSVRTGDRKSTRLNSSHGSIS